MPHERHHATLFVDPGVSAPLEAMRQRWDPVMAGQIAAHVTLVYPWEATRSDMIAEWMRAAAQGQAPFRLRVSGFAGESPLPGDGLSLPVLDVDGGHAALRSAIASPHFAGGDVSPHVTIVHPRTSQYGPEAWMAWQSVAVDFEFWVREIALTAWDGDRWPTLVAVTLSG
jgi:hypothetical protein